MEVHSKKHRSGKTNLDKLCEQLETTQTSGLEKKVVLGNRSRVIDDITPG